MKSDKFSVTRTSLSILLMAEMTGRQSHTLPHSFAHHHYPFVAPPQEYIYPRRSPRRGSVYPTEEIGVARIFQTDEKLVIKLDVQLFHPDEITVKVSEGFVVVEGNHGGIDVNVSHGHGDQIDDYRVTRSFQRKFPLPKHADPDNLTSDISSDGYLIVHVPLISSKCEEDNNGKLYKVTHALGSLLHLPNWHQSFELPNETPGIAWKKDSYSVSLEVPNFQPHHIQVKTSGDILIIQGCVDEDTKVLGGHKVAGAVKVNFTRKYPLPFNADKEGIQCQFSQNMDTGIPVLKVIVPRIAAELGETEKEHQINVV